jgi:hypothetical protein
VDSELPVNESRKHESNSGEAKNAHSQVGEAESILNRTRMKGGCAAESE